MRDGLKLAEVVQSNSALSGLVGISIDTLAIESIALHLEALSIPDCNHLLQIIKVWLTQPSPLARMLQGERDFDLTILRSKCSDSAALLKMLKNMLHSAQNPPSNPLDIEQLTTLVQSVEANPQTVTLTVDQALPCRIIPIRVADKQFALPRAIHALVVVRVGELLQAFARVLLVRILIHC